ncbi:iron complex outermembrane recepter protein [Sphingobium faniae]|nr:iron complex outermembrane recepter protein [Sphingobium faniae]
MKIIEGYLRAGTCATAVMLAAGAMAEDALAQEAPPQVNASGLSEIIVTAQRRAERQQDVPVAISAADSTMLAQIGITRLNELQRLSPNLNIYEGGGIVQPFLRGIGTTSTPVGNEPSVAVYLDGVYYSRLPYGFFSLANIERVEVLKGPQGTLFGRNSSGGLINIITPEPSFTTKVDANLGYGSFDTIRGDLYATTALSDKVAWDVSVAGVNQGDGWGRNVISGRKNGFANFFAARSKLLFQMTDDTKAIVTGFYSFSRASGQGNSWKGTTQGYNLPPYQRFDPLPGYYDVRGNDEQREQSTGYGGTLKIVHDGGIGTLTATSSYLHLQDRFELESDYTDRREFLAFLPGRIDQFSQELQLSGKNGPVSWVGGLFYYHSVSQYQPVRLTGLRFADGVRIFSRQKADSIAAYGQGDIRLTDQLGITLGLRITNDGVKGNGRQDIVIGGTPVVIAPQSSASDKSWRASWRTAVNYKFTPDVMGYVSYSRGYKAATYNLVPFSGSIAQPETLDAYELGVKTELFDRHARINASLFWYDVKSLQVQLLDQGLLVLSNADSSRSRGAEIDGLIKLSSALSTRFAASYLDAKFRKYDNAPSVLPNPNPPYGGLPPIAIDAAGNRTPMSSKWTFSAGFTYTVPTSAGDLELGADYVYNSGYYFEADNFIKQPHFDLIDARARITPRDNLSVTVWGKNLGNSKYAIHEAASGDGLGYSYTPASPRTYGVTVGVNF